MFFLGLAPWKMSYPHLPPPPKKKWCWRRHCWEMRCFRFKSCVVTMDWQGPPCYNLSFVVWPRSFDIISSSQQRSFLSISLPQVFVLYLKGRIHTVRYKPLVTGHKCWKWYCPSSSAVLGQYYRQVPTTLMTGNKWCIPDLVNVPKTSYCPIRFISPGRANIILPSSVPLVNALIILLEQTVCRT